MRRFDSSDADFDSAFTAFLHERRGSPADVDAAVAEIIEAVRTEGLAAVLPLADRIAMATPPGKLQPAVLAAAKAAGVTEIWRLGGAHGVAALAYGAGPILPVDKIVGPGNAYVTAAKRRLYGVVGIDALAGPSEI